MLPLPAGGIAAAGGQPHPGGNHRAGGAKAKRDAGQHPADHRQQGACRLHEGFGICRAGLSPGAAACQCGGKLPEIRGARLPPDCDAGAVFGGAEPGDDPPVEHRVPGDQGIRQGRRGGPEGQRRAEGGDCRPADRPPAGERAELPPGGAQSAAARPLGNLPAAGAKDESPLFPVVCPLGGQAGAGVWRGEDCGPAHPFAVGFWLHHRGDCPTAG